MVLNELSTIGTHPTKRNENIFLINFLSAINPESLMFGFIFVFMFWMFGIHKDRYIF
jgi:hypothetical protein